MMDAQTNRGKDGGSVVGKTADGSGVGVRRLGDLLVETGLITALQLAEAEAVQKKTGAFLPKVLVQSKSLTQENLNACFVKRCKIPHISLLDYDVGRDVLALVPQEVCLKNGLIPIDKLGRILTIAMVDPLDGDALDLVRQACPELRIKPILCNWTHFEQVTEKYFAEKNKSDGGSGAGLSAASFGLAPEVPKTHPVARKVAPAPSIPEVSAAGSAPSATSVDTGALVSAIQTGFHGMAEALEAKLPRAGGAVTVEAPEFPMETFATVIQASMRDALGEAMKAVERAPLASEPASPAAVSAPEFPMEAFATVIQTSMRDALGEALKAVGSPTGSVAPDWSGLENAFRASIDELKTVVRTPPTEASPTAPGATLPPGLEATLKNIAEVLSRVSDAPSSEIMAEAIRESVGGAMQEALATIVVQLRASAKPAAADTPDFEAFAEMIRDTLGGIMQEALATLFVQSRANAPSENHAPLKEVVVALRESQTAIATSMHEMLSASQESQTVQGERLTAIATAAVESSQQTSQLIEASMVQNERVQGLQKGRRAAHTSVAPFGTGGGPDADVAHAEEDALVRDSLESEAPLESLTFNTFLPGETNAFTAKLCQAVAEKPGSEYNPLFLYGSVGLGKTHLISAVGNHIQQNNPNHRVGYVSASHFSRRLSEAVAADAQVAFRDNYCHWDVLILDDIQFMGGHVDAQEEFFHIFNVLHQRGRQIIIASDKAPDRLGLLEQRLVSRFASGIVAELKPPEWETRMKILRQQLAQSGATLPEEICSLVAMRVSGDIRKMVGSLRKIMAFSALSKETITVEMATEILSHIGGEEAA